MHDRSRGWSDGSILARTARGGVSTASAGHASPDAIEAISNTAAGEKSSVSYHDRPAKFTPRNKGATSPMRAYATRMADPVASLFGACKNFLAFRFRQHFFRYVLVYPQISPVPSVCQYIAAARAVCIPVLRSGRSECTRSWPSQLPPAYRACRYPHLLDRCGKFGTVHEHVQEFRQLCQIVIQPGSSSDFRPRKPPSLASSR